MVSYSVPKAPVARRTRLVSRSRRPPHKRDVVASLVRLTVAFALHASKDPRIRATLSRYAPAPEPVESPAVPPPTTAEVASPPAKSVLQRRLRQHRTSENLSSRSASDTDSERVPQLQDASWPRRTSRIAVVSARLAEGLRRPRGLLERFRGRRLLASRRGHREACGVRFALGTPTRVGRFPTLLDPLLDVSSSEIFFRAELVVLTTEDLDVLRRVRAAVRLRFYVMKLEERLCAAPSAILAHEAA